MDRALVTFVTKLRKFSTGTGAAASTVVVSHGLGLAPKFLYVFWIGRTDTVDANGLATHFRGASIVDVDGAIVHRAVGTMSQHNVATASRNCKTVLRDDAAVVLLTTAGATDGLLAVQSVDTSDVTFVVNDQFSASIRCMMVAMGGTDITNVSVGTLTAETAGTPPFTEDYTNPGFDVSDNRGLLITLGCKSTVINTGVDDSDMYLGWATSAAMQHVHAMGSNNNQATNTQGVYYNYDSECLAQLNAGCTAPEGRATFDSWITNGFRLNWLEVASAARLVGYAVIKGPRFALGTTSLSGTLSATTAVTGAGFTPSAGILTGNGVLSTQDNQSQDDYYWCGGWDGVGSEGSFHVFDDDNVATSVVATRVDHDASSCRVNTSGNSSGTWQLQSIDGDGCTYVNTEGGTGQTGTTVFIAAAPGGSAGPLVNRIALHTLVGGALAV